MAASVWARLLSVAAVAAVTAPSVALAQQTLDSVTVTAQRRAEELYEKAVALQAKPRAWREAAHLHQRSAALRAAEDPKGDESLRLSGYLLYHIGDRQAARQLIERAASRSAARGDVIQAAISYVDAAHVALEQRSTEQASALGRKAMTLASSPLITATQRADIVRRMTPALQTAMVEAP